MNERWALVAKGYKLPADLRPGRVVFMDPGAVWYFTPFPPAFDLIEAALAGWLVDA